MQLEHPIAGYSGNPQIEDGYTKIANELLEAIVSFNFSCRQYKVLLAVIRKTYGFNKISDDISLSQIEKMCALQKSHVSTAIKNLVEMNVIFKRYGSRGFNLSLNKRYDDWILLGAKKEKETKKKDLSLHNHYVYKVSNNLGQYYIGVRSCLCLPSQDRYKGSGNWIATQEKHLLKKEIIGHYNSRKEAEIAEAKIIIEYKDDINNMNKALYKKNNGILHNEEPVTEYVTSYIKDNELVTEKVTKELHNMSPQKTTPKDNTNIYVECLNYLNEKSKKKFKPVKTNLDFIKARFNEGYTKEDIFHVIDVKCSQWIKDDEMNQYLRPATLFNATKFSQYVAEQIKHEATKWKPGNKRAMKDYL